jgi:hypothetical protein
LTYSCQFHLEFKAFSLANEKTSPLAPTLGPQGEAFCFFLAPDSKETFSSGRHREIIGQQLSTVNILLIEDY